MPEVTCTYLQDSLLDLSKAERYNVPVKWCVSISRIKKKKDYEQHV